MYHFLTRYLPEPLASVLTALWFALLLFLIVYFGGIDSAVFRYIEI